MPRAAIAAITLLGLAVAGWLGAEGPPAVEPPRTWIRVTDGVVRSSGFPTTFALIEDREAILIGASAGADLAQLKTFGVDKIRGALLTHHDRGVTAPAHPPAWLQQPDAERPSKH